MTSMLFYKIIEGMVHNLHKTIDISDCGSFVNFPVQCFTYLTITGVIDQKVQSIQFINERRQVSNIIVPHHIKTFCYNLRRKLFLQIIEQVTSSSGYANTIAFFYKQIGQLKANSGCCANDDNASHHFPSFNSLKRNSKPIRGPGASNTKSELIFMKSPT